MDFNFNMPVQVLSGEGCLLEGGDKLKPLGKRCLIVTGANSARACGALDDAIKVLGKVGIETTVFPGIGQNPLLSQCQAAAYAAQTCRVDFLMGIGGGSVMDGTKAAAWLAANPVLDAYKIYEGLRRPALPTVLVGTTAGTGSEVSATAVITMDRDGRKKSINGPNCVAKLAFCDPRYTYTLSRPVTVSTALDAFAHAVEGYLSPGCGDAASLFAEKALPMISEGLWWLIEKEGTPNAGMREQLLYASLWAGMVLNACGTAFPHPFSYILTEDFGVPHGMACAIFLPALTRRAEDFCPAKTDRLFTLCGGREAYYEMLEKLVTVDVHMTETQVEGYRSRWIGLKNFERTPGGFTPEEGAALFRQLFVR